jgi:hypothetical protein
MSRKRKHTLAILALFKNEATNIAEWISHYAMQGATKIVLVNNNSDDDWQKAIKRCAHRQIVEVKEDTRHHMQKWIYREMLRSGIFEDCKWLLICDLDEFVYARKDYTSIASFLDSFPLRKVGAIMLPWKNFGSSGHNQQPRGLRKSFITRARVPFPEPVPGFSRGKYLCRMAFTRDVNIHFPYLKKGRYILSSGLDISHHLSHIYGGFAPTSESELEASFLHVNHYPIQSKAYFTNVKSSRGDAYFSDPALQVKTIAYFEKFDRSDVVDEELAYLARRQERLILGWTIPLKRMVAALD